METASNDEAECPDCPICLETMKTSELAFVMPCQNCDYNFCSSCVAGFVQAARDDFQEASDGSRQVKVHIACPQCRTKYPIDISKVLLLRRIHMLGTEIYDKQGDTLDDSCLSASLLSMKHELYTHSQQRQVELAFGLYRKVMGDQLSPEHLEAAEVPSQRFFQYLPELSCESEDGEEPIIDQWRDDAEPPLSPRRSKISVDDSLFQGLQELMGRDEKMFLTDLLTSGDVSKLAQAAMILNGVLKLSMQPPSMRPRRSFETENRNRNYKREAEWLEKTKKRFPLACHMPGYFILTTFTPRQNYLVVEDSRWDGAIVPPARGNRVFDQVYGKDYTPPNSGNPRPVVQIQAVRGPAGRVGLRKGDIVTHINELEWTGTAQELMDHLYSLQEQQPDETVSVTVNSNPETARFLMIRRRLMEEQATANGGMLYR
eukprot:Nitzschia sp. Nitz4//scaffold19_size178191//108004//109293//NITZ4_001988-RA/size178191-processed-gene-0.71-mRNA-1//-1//CDS//3329540714//6118//frame0